jgi:hypothetical protein
MIASIVASPGEQAAKMLVEADAGFLGDPGGIGIQGVEKILNLLPDLRPNEGNRPTA